MPRLTRWCAPAHADDAADDACWEAYEGPDSLEDLPLKKAVLEAGVVSFVHVDKGQGDF